MQLATSQRPHPPPVPPRPSRQVVAEALKRSPRPPCPTRQAPPPPNTKPWRSNQQQQQQQHQQQQQVSPTGGRTIVYESTKECAKDETVLNDRNQQDRKQGQGATIDDRNAEDSCSENPTDRRKSNDGKILASSHDHQHQQYEDSSGGVSEKSQALHSMGNLVGNVVRKQNSLTEDQRPRRPSEIRRNSRGKDQINPLDHRSRCKEDAIAPAEKVEAAVVGSRDRAEATSRAPPVAARTNVSFEEEYRASSSPDTGGGRVAVSHSEKCSGSPEREANGHDSRPTPTCRLCPGEQQQQQQQEASLASEKAIRNGAEVAIERSGPTNGAPSVDRATTVLVVDDEAERKITLDDEDNNDNDSDNNIHRQDWLEAGVHYSSTQITLHGDGNGDTVDGDRINGYDHREEERITDLDFISIQERIAMSSLQGLPPLPRSLSGFNLSGGRSENGEPPPPPTRSSSKSQRGGKTSVQSSSRPSPPARQLTTLDTQLAVLRREMFGLRQLDLSLLSQLWSLNESIQEFRQLLQEQEDRAPSPSPSSEEGDDTSYGAHPPPPPRRPAPTLHHHRPPRPPRPPRPSPSDDSPSSEEYGAV
ncbi:uncharacterized protein LOC116841727 isoform X1 [Odontomachus brunneus]|uniref:uncharacterized protein LOC116841727 isoform X1 n=2 Tax=Odontomachus brunneus TaxID=486640 RepID=UPI0013F1BD32|nr:uncharacterized protein LOC116841727 isoform X1 [Odontomachus brunneus]